MNDETPVKLELTPPVVRLIVTVLRRSDPMQIYAAGIIAEIERQASGQQPKETEKP